MTTAPSKAPSVAELYETAYRFYQGGQYEDAQHVFRLLTCLDVRNPNHWMGLASALKMQKKYSDAVDAFSAAALLEKNETNPLPHAYAAECLFALGDLARARQALASATMIAKENHSYQMVEQLILLEERWFKNKE